MFHFITKQFIIKSIFVFLFLIIFHFLITTFIRFQLGYDMWIGLLNSSVMNLWKDIYLVFLYLFISIYFIKNRLYKCIWKTKVAILGIIISLTVLAIVVSLFNQISVKEFVIWFKYDIWILVPIFFFSLVDWNKKDIKLIFNYFLSLIKVVLVVSILFEIVRSIDPRMLYLLWFGEIWDFVVWEKPPVYYLTWNFWVRRLSWIFSWPNHFAFFLVAFWPIVFFNWLFKKKIHYFWIFIFIWLLLWTLSRSWLLAFILENICIYIYLAIYWSTKIKLFLKKWMIFWGITLLWLLIVWYISWFYHQILLRWSSTVWHINALFSAWKLIVDNPIWYWLWTAWPASHYISWWLIPESWWLQIVIELWVLWFLIWSWLILYIIWYFYHNSKHKTATSDTLSTMQLALAIWLIWLSFQWLFLHSFEDSMISLPLFLLCGILIRSRVIK